MADPGRTRQGSGPLAVPAEGVELPLDAGVDSPREGKHLDPRATGTAEAFFTLNAYVRGGLTLDELIDWAELVESSGPDDPWLRRVAADLANPLLCREQAIVLVREHLRTRVLQEP